MAYANVENTAIHRSRLMSGVRIEDLALPASLDVRPTGGNSPALVLRPSLSEIKNGAER